ncbi:yjeF C-terminal region, hydroxyethylthiazole kinase-related [Carnobacterium alterfunditum]|uniref:ADP-dependent (S)-NAD(P)H-hydrate dehydratase n=1 Tax=Carnobacterium alterfunditum TaxID=28230 RepID=A0A1N6G0Y9_9LACT|nr:yjeF C-terminal region, hydroxyethylthiazole kinase-related [Carnobacterium alterfunditum]
MKEINPEAIHGMIPKRNKDSYKADYGRVLVIGGNEDMGGAIILTASAAVYSGAGLVTVATAKVNHTALHARLPEAMVFDMYNEDCLLKKLSTATVIVIGPGLGLSSESLAILKSVLKTVTKEQRLIIDGSAITLMAKNNLKTPVAITTYTPHLGEWRKLSHLKPTEQNETLNIQARKELKAAVVLKQSRTEIYFLDEVWKNTHGNPAMATGGMGDTLAGMIAGFSAQFKNNRSAIITAVFLHSKIGDDLAKKQYVVLPSQIIERIPTEMKEFSTMFIF